MRVVYVSYDGALDPLGQSQVVPYLEGLAAEGVRLALVSFEKPERWADAAARGRLEDRLREAGIRWRPLRYHPRPRLFAKAWDLAAGAWAVRDEAKALDAVLVHCRADVAAAIARLARLPRRVRLLYDVRGFFSAERTDAGSWPAGGAVDRVVRRVERGNLARADGVVVLTEAAAADLAAARRLPPHRVIPTCVDVAAYRPPAAGDAKDYGLAYAGSLGTWYSGPAMVSFAQVARRHVPGPVLFLTPQPQEAAAAGASPEWSEVRTAAPAEVPAWLRRCRAVFFFYRPGRARRATCPTKFAEALATGLPVVANTGIGDLDQIVSEHRVGVLVSAFDEAAYDKAGRELAALLEDPETPGRCRRLAEERFGVAVGVSRYLSLYRQLTGRPGAAG
ncbi:MAG TPA: glycosyltransferase [Vicinamibacteria bacterium]